MSLILSVCVGVLTYGMEFHYDEHGSDWHHHFNECGNDRQSPINIDTTLINCIYPLELTKESLKINDDQRRTFDIINNGHTIDVHDGSNNAFGSVSELTDINGQSMLYTSSRINT